MPISTQIVPRTAASSLQSKCAPARVVALTNVTLEARSRWVTEMPAYAVAPSGDGTPGTTSNGMPALPIAFFALAVSGLAQANPASGALHAGKARLVERLQAGIRDDQKRIDELRLKAAEFAEMLVVGR